MKRLTEKDDLGNWCLKGVRWEQLRAGHVITLDVAEKLYGALCKLRDYEDTGEHPDGVEMLIEKYAEVAELRTVLKKEWIPVKERLPEEDEYVVMSFENFTLPIIGRYEKDNDGGGAWYAGDDDGCDTCSSQDLFVNAWMPLPKPYRANMEEKPDASADWKGHYMGRFEKVE